MVEDYIQVKHGRKQPVYEHEVMKEVLEETHGVMVYQEQVMRILNRLGGITLANAYSCIKAISKKKKLDSIAKFREEFIEGAHQKGMAKKTADEVFSLIEKFAGYGFNKSHSTAYALIAYMTAYLKAHYKVEFMAALLSSDIPGRNFKKKDSLVEHIEDSQRMNIEVQPPDVNRSDVEFAVGEGNVFYALSAIKGCGGSAAAAIVKARKTGGPYRAVSLTLRAARSGPGQPHGHRVAREGRSARFVGRAALAVVRRHRPRLAGGRLGRRRSPQRAKGPLRRRRGRHTRDDRQGSAGPARMGSEGPPGEGKGSSRLLPHEPSSGGARQEASWPIALTRRSRRPP